MAGGDGCNGNVATVVAFVVVVLREMGDHYAVLVHQMNFLNFARLRIQKLVKILWLVDELRLGQVVAHSKLSPKAVQHQLGDGFPARIHFHFIEIQIDAVLVLHLGKVRMFVNWKIRADDYNFLTATDRE